MPKMNVNIALGSEELERFDRWRGETPRGVALVKLLDLAERQEEEGLAKGRVVERDDYS